MKSGHWNNLTRCTLYMYCCWIQCIWRNLLWYKLNVETQDQPCWIFSWIIALQIDHLRMQWIHYWEYAGGIGWIGFFIGIPSKYICHTVGTLMISCSLVQLALREISFPLWSLCWKLFQEWAKQTTEILFEENMYFY